jgi:hypothetical protein
MEKFHIELTAQEREFVARMDLRSHHDRHDEGHATYLGNQEPLLALLDSLSARDGIPEHRIRYWNDPEYKIFGPIRRSHRDLFARNNHTEEEIYTHPGFVEHLRYFLYGTELPDPVVTGYEAEVGEPKWVSPSDAIPLGKATRAIVRRHALDPYSAAEEFFKLSLDLGLSLRVASSVASTVRKMR